MGKPTLELIENLPLFEIKIGKMPLPTGGGSTELVDMPPVRYFDTSNSGIEIWYMQSFKGGTGNETYFYESIENPSRYIVLETAQEMGQKRDYLQIVKDFYKEQGRRYPLGNPRQHIPSWYPFRNGPIGFMFKGYKDNREYIGIDIRGMYSEKMPPLLKRLQERYLSEKI